MATAFASASAAGPDLDAVLEEVASRALADLGPGDPADLAVLFVTPDFGEEHAAAGPWMQGRTRSRHLLGCSAAGVIGSEAEREEGRAAALFLARLPGARLHPFRVVQEELAGTGPTLPHGDGVTVLAVADPFTVDVDGFLSAGNVAWHDRPVIGGLASGGNGPGIHRLWLDGKTFDEGVAGITVAGGEVEIRPLVSQGCRPIGRRLAVTAVGGTRLQALAGKPAGDALREAVEGLTPADRRLARTSLHLGVVANESSPDFRRGDFLIRNLLGIHPEDGALEVGAALRVGQTVQFQLRDASTATEDLTALLDEERRRSRPSAGLLFSCGGRGTHLFGEPDHDLRLVQEKLGRFPLAGFFCNGEIGPVGDRNFVHGFTSSLALFAAPRG